MVSEGKGPEFDSGDSAGAHVALAGTLGVRDVSNTCERLRGAFEQPGPIEIDLRELTGLDISIVQLLIAAFKSAERLGRDLRLLSDPAGPLHVLLVNTGLLPPDDGRETLHDRFRVGLSMHTHNSRDQEAAI